MQRFYVLNTLGGGSDLCVVDRFVDELEGDFYRIALGERIGERYPKDAVLRMTASRKGIRLAPLLGNTCNMLILSKPVCDIVRKHTEGVEIEYLPFSLLDPRGRVRSRDYAIVNPLVWVDCFDHAKSGSVFGKSDPDLIVRHGKLVVDPKKVAGAPQLFRPKGLNGEYLIGYDLAGDLMEVDNVFWEKLPFSNEV